MTDYIEGFRDGFKIGLKCLATVVLLVVVGVSGMLSIWGVFAAPTIMEYGMDAVWGDVKS